MCCPLDLTFASEKCWLGSQGAAIKSFLVAFLDLTPPLELNGRRNFGRWIKKLFQFFFFNDQPITSPLMARPLKNFFCGVPQRCRKSRHRQRGLALKMRNGRFGGLELLQCNPRPGFQGLFLQILIFPFQLIHCSKDF